MPVIECPKCSEEISSWHPDCPYCGEVIKKDYSKLIIAIVVLALAGGGFYAEGKISKQNRIKEKGAVQQQTKIENETVSGSTKKIQPVLILGVIK